MDKELCKICGEKIVKGNHFWKNHRMKEADYYHKFYSRYCKLTKELLPFKNKDSYFNNDFKGKREMAAWFKAHPEEAVEYSVSLLQKRRDKKSLIYAPSQVELRSVMMPSVVWYKNTFGNYGDLCETFSLQRRFDSEDEPPILRSIKNEAVIVIDSREQKPLKFPGYKSKISGLKYGDYALEPNRFKVHIERKNLSDFASTFGVGFERFAREVTRAKRDRAYLIVMVESSINDALHFNYLPHMKYCKVSPDYVFHNIRDLLQQFENVQFVFVDGRKKATELVKKIFGITRHPKHFDLQYLIDTKQL